MGGILFSKYRKMWTPLPTHDTVIAVGEQNLESKPSLVLSPVIRSEPLITIMFPDPRGDHGVQERENLELCRQ